MASLKGRLAYTISELSLDNRIHVFFNAKIRGEPNFSEHRFERAKELAQNNKYKKAGDICLRRARVLIKSGDQEQKLAKKILLFALKCFESINYESKINEVNELLEQVENIKISMKDLMEIKEGTLSKRYIIEFD